MPHPQRKTGVAFFFQKEMAKKKQKRQENIIIKHYICNSKGLIEW